jgi:hypothetical protein
MTCACQVHEAFGSLLEIIRVLIPRSLQRSHARRCQGHTVEFPGKRLRAETTAICGSPGEALVLPGSARSVTGRFVPYIERHIKFPGIETIH